jgi:hypothetical protein
MAHQQDPLARIYRLYIDIETRAASALESVVGSNAFGELLATSASNAMALARHANDGIDRGVRALRVAGRADVADLARQLARTEDKLERMLQLVEELEGRLDAGVAPPAAVTGGPAAHPVTTGSDVAAGQNGGVRKARARTTAATSRRRTS